MSGIDISDVRREDVPDITRLYVDSIRKHFKGTLPDEELAMWTYENEARCFAGQIDSRQPRLRLLRAGNQGVVGFTRIESDPDNPANGRLESIFVKDGHHREGYGTRLFEDAMAVLRSMGYKKMIVWTPTKGAAHGFYLKLGGVACGRKINEIRFDLTAYTWTLAA